MGNKTEEGRGDKNGNNISYNRWLFLVITKSIYSKRRPYVVQIHEHNEGPVKCRTYRASQTRGRIDENTIFDQIYRGGIIERREQYGNKEIRQKETKRKLEIKNKKTRGNVPPRSGTGSAPVGRGDWGRMTFAAQSGY